MQEVSEMASDAMRRRLLVAVGVATLLLAACNGVEAPTFNVHTAAHATEIEARQVVALVYAQAPDSEIEQLLYAGGELGRSIQRLRDRYPQIRPWLEQGIIGNTVSGFVALRDPVENESLRALLCDENRDRAFLYNQASVAVGHGGDTLNSWLPYASSTFGKEWIGQGQPGWWRLDDERRWGRGAP